VRLYPIVFFLVWISRNCVNVFDHVGVTCLDLYTLYLSSDFEDPSPERARISGDFSSHGFRRNDYSSSPPTRGELGTNSRGTHGRWEGRSGGWNDKDSDSQSDRDSGSRSLLVSYSLHAV